MPPDLPTRRSLLFVPGLRPDRFANAAASGADTVCIDLEDSVPPAHKAEALAHALSYLQRPRPAGAQEWAVRFNALSTREGWTDALAFLAAGVRPHVVLLSKVDSAAEVALVRKVWGESAPLFMALIETPAGLEHAGEIAGQARAGLMFGAADLASWLAVPPQAPVLAQARARVVWAAKAAGVEVMDTPCLQVRAADVLAAEVQRARDEGFTAKAAIHPEQVPVIQRAFTPSPQEIATARRALAAFAAAGETAVLLEDRLIEKPLIAGFRRTLALAARAGITDTEI